MKKDTFFYDLFLEIGNLGELPHAGLCNCVHEKGRARQMKILKLFIPTSYIRTYWGAADYCKNIHSIMYEFTDLRKNILLFCAAINGEL